jgi:hypothetical protein
VTTVSVDVTPIKADAAARGARLLKLAEIDQFYRGLNEDLTREADTEYARIIANLWASVRTILAAHACDATRLPLALVDGNPVPRWLATNALNELLGDVWDELAHLDARTRDTRGAFEGMRREDRRAFDFNESPPSERRNGVAA